jgi:hypothetical protein
VLNPGYMGRSCCASCAREPGWCAARKGAARTLHGPHRVFDASNITARLELHDGLVARCVYDIGAALTPSHRIRAAPMLLMVGALPGCHIMGAGARPGTASALRLALTVVAAATTVSESCSWRDPTEWSLLLALWAVSGAVRFPAEIRAALRSIERQYTGKAASETVRRPLRPFWRLF